MEEKITMEEKKTGRPKKEINYKLVESLASLFCTQEEISTIIEISVRTLQRNKEFCRVYKKGQENAKMSLRRMQFKLAEKNSSMAIFLGKQYLGQKDVIEQQENNNIMPEMKITVIDNSDLEKALYDADK